MEATTTTERLELRTLQTSDDKAIADQLNDWDVASMLARVPFPYSLHDAQDWISQLSSEDGQSELAACIFHSSTLIGVASLSRMRQIEGEKIAELGYWIGKAHWHKGYATEAARAVVALAFNKLGLAGLTSGHFKENYRSGRVLAKLGFRYAGESETHCLARNEEIPHIDVVLTKTQWQDFVATRAA